MKNGIRFAKKYNAWSWAEGPDCNLSVKSTGKLSVRVCVCLWLKNKMELNDITYKINGAVFEVNRILGPGFLEKVYENALLKELKLQGLQAESQVTIKVYYKEESVGDYYADILVEDQVILGLKTVDKIERIHEAQLLNYLKATGLRMGMLINFKNTKAEIKRFVLD
ncbi:conserved hypothetical protein [uncultured Desulfobacterium sp.]|uniref:GxxExxY protein n=1 Tax=uncultured Desulfobacterium sp. TaxID=201089 RepID=A0A445MRC6_9BACT|nr:conserved hypothetical protein [uncultured Desulfobacterium sp.]